MATNWYPTESRAASIAAAKHNLSHHVLEICIVVHTHCYLSVLSLVKELYKSDLVNSYSSYQSVNLVEWWFWGITGQHQQQHWLSLYCKHLKLA